MTKQYKALMIDVDGTLIPNKQDGLPSERVKAAIKRANQYIHIGVATSRSVSELKNIFDQVNFSGPSITSTGAQIIDPQTKKILKEHLLNKEDFPLILKILQKHQVEILINENGIVQPLTDSYRPYKLFNLVAVEIDPAIADEITTELSRVSTISIHRTVAWVPGKNDLIIAHAQVSKQHGILEVAQILGIETSEIIGIGDGYNDFPLLMACGLKVAMGNAVPQLKEIADYIAPDVKHDGVADVIEKFVLQNK